MVNVVGSRDDYSRWKPDDKQDYLTIQELSDKVGRNRRWLLALEARGDLPKPIRHKVGRLRVRLYSPEQVDKIVAMFGKVDAERERNRRDPKKRKNRQRVAAYRKRLREEA